MFEDLLTTGVVPLLSGLLKKHNCEQSLTADVSVGFCVFKLSINIQVILILSFKKKFAALIFN